MTEVDLEEPTAGVVATAPVDELGRFVFTAIPGGPVRLRLTMSTGAPVTTDWFLL